MTTTTTTDGPKRMPVASAFIGRTCPGGVLGADRDVDAA